MAQMLNIGLKITSKQIKTCLWILMIVYFGSIIWNCILYETPNTSIVIKTAYLKTDDQDVSIRDIKFTIGNELQCCECTLSEACGREKKLLVISILSARQNFFRRMAIRKSWGSIQEDKRWCIKLIFILGENKKDNLQENIIEESTIYKDIIMTTFLDNYHSLSYKTLIGFKWVLDYCSKAQYTLKTDDDVFVEIFQLLNHVNNLKDHNTISCKVNQLVVPQRNSTDRWFVNRNEYPSDVYPDYCMGTGYLISYDVMSGLYQLSSTMSPNEILWIEDVFVTGILREKMQNNMSPRLVSFASKYNWEDIDTWKNWYKFHTGEKLPWIFIQTYDEPEDELQNDFKSLWTGVLSFY